MDKEWLFEENVRLNKLEQELEAQKKLLKLEKERLRSEKKAFEQQKQVLETGFQKLAADKEMFQSQIKKQQKKERHEKERREKETERQERGQVLAQRGFCGPGFFAGITGYAALKKRYKELLKIYHPDNKNGDSFTVACINKEYEILKEKYKN
jgi:hypothetical protein